MHVSSIPPNRPLPSKAEAFRAWNSGKCSDAELDLCIASLDDMIETVRAVTGQSTMFMTGFLLMRDSMASAREFRKRVS